MHPWTWSQIIEAALLSHPEGLSIEDLSRLSLGELKKSDIKILLNDLQLRWSHQAIELVEVKSGWRFKTKADMMPYLKRIRTEKPPKYSRATMEILAIIAYKQPITRAEIEAIRGVAVSSQITQTLEDRGWIHSVGRKESPGRPRLWATTGQLLDDLGLKSLQELPLVELKTEASN